jgi:phage/plasmid-like protein (TIGR03299 family)
MAHEITSDDYMVSGNNQKPWHGLGSIVEGLITAKDALEKAKLNWKVRKEKIFTGDMVEIPDNFVTVREDTNKPLGIVGNRYTIVNNVDGLDILDPIIGNDAVYETAGSLRGGKIVWFLAKLNKQYFLRHNDDRMNQYCMIFLSHDGSKPVSVRFTNVRVVCNNTLSAAIRGSKAEVTIRHTTNYKNKIGQAHEILKLADKHAQEFSSLMLSLDSQPISPKEAHEKLTYIFPGEGTRVDNTRAEVFNLFREGKGNEGKTKSDLLNGVTEYVTHNRATRVSEGGDEKEMRFESVMFGSGLKVQERALEVILS